MIPPLVTVICVCYNHAQFVAEALNSVIHQTYSHVELIVIDDGSTDNSWNVIEQLRSKNENIKGIKICRQAKANWVEKFDKRKNPQGKDYYWLSGKFVNLDDGEDTDEWALEHGYISIVPSQFDLTAHHFIQNLNSWNLNDSETN